MRATLAPGALGAPNVRLVRKITEGGMGSIWEGEHIGLKTNVAVKFVLGELDDNEEALTRFAREATATARIKSPHVVQVFDHGKNEDGLPYMVMEFLEGEDLEARLERDGKLPPALVFQITLQAAKALAKAHDLGIVHRDVKPSNIFLTDLEGEVFVKILDFGIAKLSHDDPLRMSMTQTGAVIGTPYFMAPEQMTSAKDAGPTSDIWSLGVIAYRALTGRLPYESDTLAGLAMAIERGKFPAVSLLVPDLPAGINDWFKRAIAKNPSERFANIREMSEELGKLVRTQAGHQVLTSSSPPPSMRAGAKEPAAELAALPKLPSVRPEVGATTQMNRPLTQMSSTQALAAHKRSSSRRLVVVGVVASVLGSLGALGWFLYESARSRQAAADAAAASAVVEQGATSSSSRADDPAAPSSAAPDASAVEAPSAEPSASAPASASASAPASASAALPPPVRPPPPRPLPPRPSAAPSATAPPAPKPSASAPPPAPKPSVSAPPPKPSAAPPAPKPSGSVK